MPTTETVNTQQVLQMGTHAEKLQQTMQNQQLTTAQQLEDERKKQAESQRTEVQDMEDMKPPAPTRRERDRRKQVRIRQKASETEKDEPPEDSKTFHPEDPHGKTINLKV